MLRSIALQGKGKTHEKMAAPCQDFTYISHQSDVNIVSLADGAGSAKLSQYGAEIMTKQLSVFLSGYFDSLYENENGVQVKQQIITILQNEITVLAQELNCEIKDLSSTLLSVAVKGNHFILIHLGDGVIGCIKNGEVVVATHPENGEFCNQTYFTTSSDAISKMQLVKGSMDEIAGFILMSDGTEASLYDKRKKKLAPAAMKLMFMCATMEEAECKTKLETIMTEIFTQRTGDDCSIAMLVDDEKLRKIIIANNDPYKQKYTTGVKYENEILMALEHSYSVKQISKLLHINTKAIYRKVNNLKRRGYVVLENGKYKVLR